MEWKENLFFQVKNMTGGLCNKAATFGLEVCLKPMIDHQNMTLNVRTESKENFFN